MKYRRLGKTGLDVSVVGIGTWQFGGEWNKVFSSSESCEMLVAAKDLGINLIDTAECYGDHLSESLIGGFLASDRREDWILASKFGHKYHGFQQRTEPRTGPDIRRQVEDSLKSLRTDYIDLMQYHSWGDADFARHDVLDTLRSLVKEGKIRHLGNSVANNATVHQTDQSTAYGIEVIQVVYNRLDRGPETDILPSCQRQGLGVLARVPLASGYLSGKYKPGASFEPGDVRSNMGRAELDARLAEAQRIGREEVPPGVPMARWALAWCLKHPACTAVIPGCMNVQQVRDNAAAAELIEG